MNDLSRTTQKMVTTKTRKVDFNGHSVQIEYYQVEHLTEQVLLGGLTRGYLLFYNGHTGFYLSKVPISHYKIMDRVNLRERSIVYYSGGQRGTLILNAMKKDGHVDMEVVETHLKKLPTWYCARLVGKTVVICDVRKQIPIAPDFGQKLSKRVSKSMIFDTDSRVSAVESSYNNSPGREYHHYEQFKFVVMDIILDMQSDPSFTTENLYYSKNKDSWVLGVDAVVKNKAELASGFSSYNILKTKVLKTDDKGTAFVVSRSVFKSEESRAELFEVLYRGLAVLHYDLLKNRWLLVGSTKDYTNGRLDVIFDRETGDVLNVVDGKSMRV